LDDLNGKIILLQRQV